MTRAPTLPSADQLDAADPLSGFRQLFEVPQGVYLVGNSLGAMPRSVRDYLGTELDRWSDLGVEGHFIGELRWKDYHALLSDQLARLVGARPSEVVAMNALTVNLHLLMVSFYRPTPKRYKILIEAHAFPSDHFAVESQIRQRGFDPDTAMVVVAPRDGDETLRPEDLTDAIAYHGDELAMVLLPGVQYYTGQVLPMADLVEAAHAVGAYIGFDLAHAVGNIELQLTRWDADFAAWCSYKYLNAGPGGVGGAYVNHRHLENKSLPKLTGWWGTNPDTRFEMATHFDAMPTAESWQLSNAPVLAMAALRASLDIFDRAGGITALREKSIRQIEFLDRRLNETMGERITNLTPKPLDQRGCQFALQLRDGNGRQVYDRLTQARVFCDWREPDVIRVAPVPLYNSFADIDQFVRILDEVSR